MAAGHKNYQQWLAGAQLENQGGRQDYSVPNHGLRSGLTGTSQQMVDRIVAFETVGINLFLLQCYPQLKEMECFSGAMIQLLA